MSHLHLHLHSHLVRPVRVGSGILPDQVARRVVGYMILALAVFGGGALLISPTGPDIDPCARPCGRDGAPGAVGDHPAHPPGPAAPPR